MKVTKTYSIEESLYNTFDSLTSEKNINKSSFFEDAIKKYIKDNDLDAINKQYVSKSDPNNIVTVINQDQTYYILDDGSKIQIILFLHLFNPFNGINPDDFFNEHNIIYDNIIEKIKDIDTSDIVEYSSPVSRHKILDYKTLGIFNLSDKNSFERIKQIISSEKIEPIDITNKIWKNIEEKEKEKEEINEVDPNVFFKENTIIKDIVDNIMENNSNKEQKEEQLLFEKQNQDMNNIMENIDEQDKEKWKKTLFESFFDNNIKEEKEERFDEDEILQKYYNDYLVGGFITKTKSELIEIIRNINKCGNYFKEKFELLNIIRKYYYNF
jgi:hypothetical protein